MIVATKGGLRPEDIAPWAHDIRNSLQAVQFASGDLEERLGGGGKRVKEALLDITHATLQMRALLDGLLATCEGEVDPIHWVHVPVKPLITGAERRLRIDLERRLVRPVVKRGRLPGAIATDPIRIQRALDNLVVNAVRHSRDGQVRIYSAGDATELRVRITNSGPTLDPGRIEACALAHPVHKSLQHGWGLGIVIDNLARLGATLEVDVRRGQPPRFELIHPTSRPGPVAAPANREEAFRRVVSFLRSRAR